MDRKTYKKKSKGRKLRKRFLIILLPLLLVGFIAIGYSVSLYVKAQDVANESYEEVQNSDKRDEVVDPNVDHVSILFLGVDESDKRKNASGFEGGASRSDAMILATLNNDDKSVKLTSIPRDTLAYIPEVGIEDKINHAHAFGGPKASMETVEGLLDVPVDYYVRMNFYAFIDVVEALNGVEVEVPFDMEEMNSDDSTNAISLKEGRQLLNGEEALAFARSRSYDSDVARGGRQLEVMEAILDRSTSVGSISKYSDVIEAIGNNMKTNMKFEDMRSFISYATNSDLKVDMQTLEGEAVTYNGIYYYEAYEEELANLRADLQEHLGMSDPNGTPEAEGSQHPAVENTEEPEW
ncbi:LytR family transcriptional regulator [Jeotgalibacillus sp. S-D1]|uniref:LCP family protein n=1 Tax=Jeotgalibacillus sp. S-D1 TaxID=2552189 RepID=UPI00105A1D3A|nr:LCP family protein [Jeotgalibacillus sp. S-D1]TDL32598.1 LytR family transcriptional regulator [Jeotgalibacillus sp. S-D1]